MPMTKTKTPEDMIGLTVGLLKAIAHPARLTIIKMLDEQFSLAVQEISERLQMEQSLTSHHLAVMREKGVLGCLRKGQRMMYYLKLRPIIQILNSIEQYAPEIIEELNEQREDEGKTKS